MSKTETLTVDLLRLDGDTQSRVAVSEDTVDDYAEIMKRSETEWPFEPVTVFHDGSHYWVADGFHRTLAVRKAGRASVPCRVVNGTAQDARMYGMTANDKHGLRMSREDRRKNVGWLLEMYPDLTHKDIAAHAGVSVRTVEYVVAERKPVNPQIAGSVKTIQGESSTSGTNAASDGDDPRFDADPALTPAEAKAAAKAAKETEKAAARAEAKKAREEALAAREQEKAEKRAAAAAAREQEKAEKRAAAAAAREQARKAKIAALPADEQARLNRDVVYQLVIKAVNAIDDYNRSKKSPYVTPQNMESMLAMIHALRGNSRHIAGVKLMQHVLTDILW